MVDPPPPVEASPLEYREYFASRRPSSFGERVLRSWHRRLLRLAIRFLPELPQSRVVEVGAGWGFFAEACRERGIPYEGIELDAQQAGALRAAGFDVRAGAVPPFPEGGAAQVVWMSHVLEHALDHRHAMAMVRSAFERLDPGGALVVIGPDVLAWGTEFWNCDWSHGYPTSRRRVEQLMAEAGFVRVASRSHVATLDQPVLVPLLALLFRMVPYRLIDAILLRTIGRDFAYSFMGVYGWKQILVIGRRPGSGQATG
jgi:SAM-dependent methyltransferase